MVQVMSSFTVSKDVQKKNMICKTSFLNHKSPCHPLKIIKLINKREEQRINVRKTAVIFPQKFREALGGLVRLGITTG